jgi:hypothetical protein
MRLVCHQAEAAAAAGVDVLGVVNEGHGALAGAWVHKSDKNLGKSVYQTCFCPVPLGGHRLGLGSRTVGHNSRLLFYYCQGRNLICMAVLLTMD